MTKCRTIDEIEARRQELDVPITHEAILHDSDTAQPLAGWKVAVATAGGLFVFVFVFVSVVVLVGSSSGSSTGSALA